MNSSAQAAQQDRIESGADLLRRAVAGDRDALASIVDAHHSDMLRVSFVVCGDRETAREAVQSAWLRAATRLGSIHDHARLRAWLCSVAANEARMALRRRRPTLPIEALDGHPAEARALSVDLIDLAIALNGLTPADRELLALRYVAGFSSPELADHARMTPAGVRSRLKRLLDRLRKELDR
ncbi:MAG TPA: RNA polymerase sigma factor [Candidatus Limnocylindrales bacterium]|nr:RNA polymerase sigma factor [Candidatus Limnocylindrales bacterium]